MMRRIKLVNRLERARAAGKDEQSEEQARELLHEAVAEYVSAEETCQLILKVRDHREAEARHR